MDLLSDCITYYVDVTFIFCLPCEILFEDFEDLGMSCAKGIEGKDVGPSETMIGNELEVYFNLLEDNIPSRVIPG